MTAGFVDCGAVALWRHVAAGTEVVSSTMVQLGTAKADDDVMSAMNCNLLESAL
jgi:hypothetical protein